MPRVIALVGRLPLLACLALILSLGSPALGADPGKAPEKIDLPPLAKGDAVLDIATAKGVQSYDLATIEELGVYRLTTTSPFEDGDLTFEGVLLADLLAKEGIARRRASSSRRSTATATSSRARTGRAIRCSWPRARTGSLSATSGRCASFI